MVGENGRALDAAEKDQEAEGCRKHLFRARADFYRRQETGHRRSLKGYRRGFGEKAMIGENSQTEL